MTTKEGKDEQMTFDDIYLIAYLRFKGFKMGKIDRSDRRVIVEMSGPKLSQAVSAYYQSEIREYIENYRKVKDIFFKREGNEEEENENEHRS